MNKVKKILIFSLILSAFCIVYLIIAPQQIPHSHHSWRHEFGGALGSGVLWLFAFIYGRTLLKLLLRQGPVMERLLPEGTWKDAALPWARKALRFLNQTHPFLGAAVVILIMGHAWLEGPNQVNLLMKVIIILALWQFAFGLFLLNRYQVIFVKKMKKYGYMAHSQLYTGVAIGICAIFGHLLVGK